MRVMNDDKKPSLEEALKHYGVRGMRWGVRKSRGDRSAFKERAKRTAKSTGKVTKEAAVKTAKAIEDYQSYKNQLRKEAFWTDLFGVSSPARTKLDALSATEQAAMDLGANAVKALNKDVRTAQAIRQRTKSRS